MRGTLPAGAQDGLQYLGGIISLFTSASLSLAAMMAIAAPSAHATPSSENPTEGRGISTLREVANSDPEVRKGLNRFDSLPDSEKAAISSYLDSPQFMEDMQTVSGGGAPSGKLKKLKSSEKTTTPSVPAHSPDYLAAGTIWQVSREHVISYGVPIVNLPVIKYWHRLHYNHNGRAVVGTRSCDGDVTGWTGAWVVEKNDPRSGHTAQNGLGYCATTWKWKAVGQGNWALNSTTRWAVNYKAEIVSSTGTKPRA